MLAGLRRHRHLHRHSRGAAPDRLVYLSLANARRQVKESDFAVAWLKDRLVADLRPTLWILLGAVVCILLIACANLALFRGQAT